MSNSHNFVEGNDRDDEMPYIASNWINDTDEGKLLEQHLQLHQQVQHPTQQQLQHQIQQPQFQQLLHLQLQLPLQLQVQVQLQVQLQPHLQQGSWIYGAAGQWNVSTVETASPVLSQGYTTQHTQTVPIPHQALGLGTYDARPSTEYELPLAYDETGIFPNNQYISHHQRQPSMSSQVLESPTLFQQEQHLHHLIQQQQQQQQPSTTHHQQAQYYQNQYHQRQLLQPEHSGHTRSPFLHRYQRSVQMSEPDAFSPLHQHFQFPPSINEHQSSPRKPLDSALADPERGKIYQYPNDEEGPSIGKLDLFDLPDGDSVSKALLQSYYDELQIRDETERPLATSYMKRRHRKRRRVPNVDIGWSPLPIASLFSDTRVQFTNRQKKEYMRRMRFGVLGVINMRAKGAWTRGPNKKH